MIAVHDAATGEIKSGRIPLSPLLAIFLVLAGVAQFLISGRYCAHYSKWILLLAVGGVALCIRALTEDGGYVAEHTMEHSYTPRLCTKIIAVAALSAGAALLFVSSRQLIVAWSAWYYKSFSLMAAGYILASFGLDHLFGYTVFRRPMSPSQRKWEIALLVLVMATAVFMRVYRFDHYPPPDGFFAIEEAQQGQRAYSLLYAGETHWEFLFSNWVTALSFWLFGISTYSLRIPPIVLSCLTVAICYSLLRTLVGYRFALFGSFLFAVSRWHMGYSRISHNIFLPVALVMLCVYLLYKTTVSTRPSLYLWIGCLAGLLLYSYAPYRCTLVLVVIFFLERSIQAVARLAKTPRGGSHPGIWRMLFQNMHKPVLIALGTLVLALPLFAKMRTMPGLYFEAAHRAVARGDDPSWYDTSDMGQFLKLRLDRIQDTSRIFTISSPSSATYNIPGEPLLDPMAGIMFILGVAVCTLTFRRERHAFVIIAFYITMAMGFLFPHNLDLVRMIVLIPQIYFLVSLLAFCLWQCACRSAGRVRRVVFDMGLLTVCFLSFVYNFNFFFNRQIVDLRVERAFGNEYSATASIVRQIPLGSFVIVVTGDIENLFNPGDFEWYRGMELAGAIVHEPERALMLAHLARGKVPVTLVLNNSYTGHPPNTHNFEEYAARVRREFPGVREERVGKELMSGAWTWALLSIPAVEGRDAAAVQRLEGYAEIMGAPELTYMDDFMGRTAVWRVTGVGSTIEWKTEKAPRGMATEYLFVGAGGDGDGPAMALLSVNEEPVLEFDLGNESSPARWQAEDYVLDALPLRGFSGKAVFYRLTAPADSVRPGKELELSVTIGGGGKDAWFALCARKDCWDFSHRRW